VMNNVAQYIMGEAVQEADLGLVLVTQFQDFELPHRVVDVTRISRPLDRLRAELGLRRTDLYGVIDALAFGVHFDRRDEAAIAQQCPLLLADLQFRVATAQALLNPCFSGWLTKLLPFEIR
jgi:hypothetical protein